MIHQNQTIHPWCRVFSLLSSLLWLFNCLYLLVRCQQWDQLIKLVDDYHSPSMDVHHHLISHNHHKPSSSQGTIIELDCSRENNSSCFWRSNHFLVSLFTISPLWFIFNGSMITVIFGLLFSFILGIDWSMKRSFYIMQSSFYFIWF